MRGVDRALGGARGAGGSSAGRRSEPEPCAPLAWRGFCPVLPRAASAGLGQRGFCG